MSVAQMHRVCKRYGTTMALDAVDLSIAPGEVLALLGPNGAGKTTSVRLLLGLASPSSGSVSVFGRDPRDRESRLGVGAMLQVPRIPEMLRVREHIELFASYYPAPLSFAEVSRAATLGDLENRRFGDLSGGQKQRVLFAIAICGNPRLLFLDEPTAGLDVETRRSLWEHIRQFARRGGSVLLTTHHLEEADALANRIAVIHRGQIVAEGTPSEIKSRTAVKKIRCSTYLSERALRGIPGVTHVAPDRERVELHTSEPERVIREMLVQDPSLADLEVSAGGLEEAFLELTNNHAATSADVETGVAK